LVEDALNGVLIAIIRVWVIRVIRTITARTTYRKVVVCTGKV